MSWIKMRTNLLTCPHVVRISSALKADSILIVGALYVLWALGDDHTEDGILSGYTPQILDSMVRIPGFSEAVKAVGWLDIDSQTLTIPRFEEHNGKSAKRRAQDAERKSRVRILSASQADTLRTREEKRREEKKKDFPAPPASQAGDEGEAVKPEPKPRKRNPIWDTVARLWYSEGVPTSQLRAIGRITQDFTELNATPEEIERRYERLKKKWPTADATARSLVKHWSQLGQAPVDDFQPRITSDEDRHNWFGGTWIDGVRQPDAITRALDTLIATHGEKEAKKIAWDCHLKQKDLPTMEASGKAFDTLVAAHGQVEAERIALECHEKQTLLPGMEAANGN